MCAYVWKDFSNLDDYNCSEIGNRTPYFIWESHNHTYIQRFGDRLTVIFFIIFWQNFMVYIQLYLTEELEMYH